MKQKLLFFTTVFFLFAQSSLFSEKVWHNVYFDNTGYSNRVESIKGDSNVIYAAESKNAGLKLLKSEDFGKSWEIIHEDFTSYPPEEWPYPTDFEKMVTTVPGHTYMLYSIGVIKKYDERTNRMIDTTYFTRHEEKYKGPFTKLHMLDSLTGVCSSLAMSFVTYDGWHSFRIIDTITAVPGGILQPYMLSKDTILTYILGLEKDCWNYCIIEPDTVRYELIGDSLSHDSTKYNPANIAVLDRKIWLVATLGTPTGVGQTEYQEIFKTTDAGETWRQVHKSNIAPSFGLQDIEFRDSLHGIATGNSITLFTEDGGETWEVHNIFRKNDWENWVGNMESTNPIVIFIDYIEDEPFLGCFSSGIFRFEEEQSGITEIPGLEPRIYPNITSPGTFVNFDIEIQGIATVYLYDIRGKLVRQTENRGSTYYIDSGITPGTYFIVVETDTGYPVREKVIVK